MPDLIHVPDDIARTAAVALARREELGGGGTARGIVIATALSTGFVRPWELHELREWHSSHPDDVQGEASTLLGGMYGGAPARLLEWDGADGITHYVAPRTASAGSLAERLAKLSAVVNRENRRLGIRLHAAAEVAFKQAVRQASDKLYAKARTKAQKVMVASAHIITPAVLAAVGVTERELLDRRFDELGASALVWMLAAERRKLLAAATALGLDPDEFEARYDDELTARAEAASAYLIASLGLLARATLAGTVTPSQGEQAGPVPFGLVRNTVTIGTTGTHPPTLEDRGLGTDIGQLRPLVEARGESLVDELLRSEGLDTVATSTWVHGDPDRPFEPHLTLDGQSWTGDDKPEDMLATEDWLDTPDGYYTPGDHLGCTCEIAVEYAPVAELESV